ncbi:MAG: hypothetical protein ACRYFX_22120 [Janthinobacterium lividum]
MAPTLLRAFRNLLYLNLGILAFAWCLGLLTAGTHSYSLQEGGLFLFYAGFYALPVTIGLLVAYGLASLLVRLADKIT